MHFPRKPRFASMPGALVLLAGAIIAVVPALATHVERSKEPVAHRFVPTVVPLPQHIEPAPSAHDYVAAAPLVEPVREGKGALLSY